MDVLKDEVIRNLDLEPIKRRLMHGRPGAPAWSQERANAAETEYRRFLFLMKTFPTELAAPSLDVDRFWHQHILDTAKYAGDCRAVFGYFLHHYPYLGLGGAEDEALRQRAGARMRELYREMFGVAPAPTATQADPGYASSVAPAPQANSTDEMGPDPGSNQLSYCAAPSRGFQDATRDNELTGCGTLQRRKTWRVFDAPDSADQLEDLLGQTRIVVTENQRCDRVAVPVM
jgi:hypothetical protein